MDDNKYDIGDKVLAYLFPSPHHENEIWLPGTIVSLLGKNALRAIGLDAA